MSTLNQELFLIRNTKTQQYQSGYGRYSTPMLYGRSSANSVCGRLNKQWGAGSYETVPVEVKEKT